MTTLANRIWLRGGFVYDEYPTITTIYPGMLCDLTATAGVNQVIVHGTKGGKAARLFAIENSLSGPSLFENAGTGQTVNTAYVSGDLVPLMFIYPGGSVNAFLLGGYSYSIGQKLVSHGDGYVFPATGMDSAAQANEIVEVWDTAFNLSPTVTDNQLCPVVVL
jgi:hypothetical protein